MRKRVLFLLAVALVPVVVRAEVEPIRICIHVPITGAAPIPRHPSRFGQFYFDAVNAEQGGVDGRPVQVLAYDDQYYPAGARAAVEKCNRQGADLYVGLVGTDQMTAVAKWADRKNVPYLHGPMARAASEQINGDASLAPTVEESATGLAHLLASNGRDLSRGAEPVFGMVVVNTPYAEDEVAAYRAALEARGYELEVVVPVQRDESQFTAAYFELRSAGVTMVNMAVPPNLMIKMIQQRPLNYDPLFASSQPAVGTKMVASATASARVIVLNDPAPTYDALDPDPRWADEIEEFHRIFDTYSPESRPERDDADWMAYLRAKQIHRMLLALDGNVTPSGFFDLFASHTETAAEAFPTCALDFASDPTFGQDAWHVFRNQAGRWVQDAFCADASSTVDLAPPRIDCGGPVVVGTEACSFTDLTSGVGSYSITASPAVGEQVRVDGNGSCGEAIDASIALPSGVYRVEARATDCAGRASAVALDVVVI